MEHSTEKNQIQGFCEDVMYRLFGMGYLSETYPTPPPTPPTQTSSEGRNSALRPHPNWSVMSGNSSVSLIGSEEQIIFCQ